jgi:hypothetical protein
MNNFGWSEEDVKNISLNDFEFQFIDSKEDKAEATEFIKRYEWLGTIGSFEKGTACQTIAELISMESEKS